MLDWKLLHSVLLFVVILDITLSSKWCKMMIAVACFSFLLLKSEMTKMKIAKCRFYS